MRLRVVRRTDEQRYRIQTLHMKISPKLTPNENRTVAIYGAGVAGLTAAYELVRRGWHVCVYEANSEAGGFFRSACRAADRNMPSEYSWHGLGPWYHNVFDLMRQIPFDESGSVYDRALSRPVELRGWDALTLRRQRSMTGRYPGLLSSASRPMKAPRNSTSRQT